ncbi:hypothetical protein [Medusavirus stheno T3]|jgi:hypothetical protein|uniref:Uncharacterized protein n=1 Tax=Medusavirus stheno T3 TaxID=3069717 RepID=A0A7S8BEI9_9VIRU|nr:hypothetical protein QKU73_gp151 [Acanthamoeba castellanii medusavirus]QPB44332.1 hypothetical protein [Medusavirus stheno T3]
MTQVRYLSLYPRIKSWHGIGKTSSHAADILLDTIADELERDGISADHVRDREQGIKARAAALARIVLADMDTATGAMRRAYDAFVEVMRNQ